MITAIIGGIASLAGQWLSNKKSEADAKHQQKLKRIQGEQDWDQIQAENARDSWKDEWLTIIFTLPFVVMFGAAALGFDQAVTQMKEAFVVLSNDVPEEYWYILGVIVSASFGVKKAGQVIAKIRGGK